MSFYPLPDNPENQQFDKLKIVPGDIIILRMYTINDNHVIGDSCDMECDGHIFLSSWTIFCLFTPLATQKIKISKKWKKSLEISSFYTCVPKIKITWCMVPEIWCKMGRGTDRWTDGRTEKVTHRGGAPPKKVVSFLNTAMICPLTLGVGS